MIVDSSAIVAVVLGEPGHDRLIDHLAGAGHVRVGAPTLAETGLVLMSRMGLSGRTLLARFVQDAPLEVLPFGAEHASVALDAFNRYGKGRHPAALNFGDCMTYAVARVAVEALLCVGDDFPRTDLDLVVSAKG